MKLIFHKFNELYFCSHCFGISMKHLALLCFFCVKKFNLNI